MTLPIELKVKEKVLCGGLTVESKIDDVTECEFSSVKVQTTVSPCEIARYMNGAP